MGSRAFRRGRELDRRYGDVRGGKRLPVGQGSRVREMIERTTERAVDRANEEARSRGTIAQLGEALENLKNRRDISRQITAIDTELGNRGVLQRMTPARREEVRAIVRELRNPNISVQARNQLVDQYRSAVEGVLGFSRPQGRGGTIFSSRNPAQRAQGAANAANREFGGSNLMSDRQMADRRTNIQLGNYTGVGFESGARASFKDTFGTENAAQVFKRLGLPEGAAMVIRRAGSRAVEVTVNAGGMSQTITFNRDTRTVSGEYMMVTASRRGLGTATAMMAAGVPALARMGFEKLVVPHAAAGGMNGAYTWPRLGANTSIVSGQNAQVSRMIGDAVSNGRLPQYATRMTTIRDVVRDPLTRQWWKENFTSLFNVEFDLRRGSQDRQYLAAYVRNSRNERRARGTT